MPLLPATTQVRDVLHEIPVRSEGSIGDAWEDQELPAVAVSMIELDRSVLVPTAMQ
jgi:hypothetical protein